MQDGLQLYRAYVCGGNSTRTAHLSLRAVDKALLTSSQMFFSAGVGPAAILPYIVETTVYAHHYFIQQNVSSTCHRIWSNNTYSDILVAANNVDVELQAVEQIWNLGLFLYALNQL
jgi:hypothetical protein